MEQFALIRENAITSEFVSPKYSLELYRMEVTANVPYFFVEQQTPYNAVQYTIKTFKYDDDAYYEQSWRNIFSTPGIRMPFTFPAYRISDIERALPEYCHVRDSLGHTIMLDKNYGAIEVKDLRLPDAFALMLAQCIKRRILTIEYINQKIII